MNNSNNIVAAARTKTEIMTTAQSKGTIVFYSVDALGHIHPILSIVRELQLRGYRAIIVTTRPLSMAPKLRAMGFELDSCLNASQQEEIEATPKNEDMIKSIMEPLMNIFRQGLPGAFEATYAIGGAVDGHLDDLIKNHPSIESKLRSLKPDLIVVDHMTGTPCTTYVAPRWARVYSGFPSVLFSAQHGFYAAGLGLKPNEVSQEWKQFEITSKAPLREKVRRFFQEMGADDWDSNIELAPTSPYLNFYLGPKELSLEHCDGFQALPNNWYRLEHTQNSSLRTSEFSVPECIKDRPGKLIYFSLGTMVTSDVNLINRLLEILSKSRNRFIISKGQMHDRIKMHSNMWGDKFIDQAGVLQRVDLFITHGGHNSIIEAFYYGVPGLLVLPVFADQFDSAQRVQDCGFGLRLNPFTCSGDELLDSVDRILSDDLIKQRMKTISERLKLISYHQLAANELEDLFTSPKTTTTKISTITSSASDTKADSDAKAMESNVDSEEPSYK